jgi:hypothetical protein
VRPLLLLQCKLPSCERRFLVCSACFRGHRYCSRECALVGRAESVRRARQKYAGSAQGRANHRDRARRHYRWRVRAESLTDQTSTAATFAATLDPAANANVRVTAKARNVQPSSSSRPFEKTVRRADAPVTCAWCGRAGARVLHHGHRFQR